MKKQIFLAVATAVLTTGLAAGSAYAASPYGTWKRPNGSLAKVWKCGGKMCAKVVSGKNNGFVMFRGISKTGSNTWKGDMKHPKMGNLFTFNGTVRLKGKLLAVKGCMIGGAMCDAETWRKK